MENTKTIRVSEDTFKRLVELKKNFEDVHGGQFLFDDVISDALDIAVENQVDGSLRTRSAGRAGGAKKRSPQKLRASSAQAGEVSGVPRDVTRRPRGGG